MQKRGMISVEATVLIILAVILLIALLFWQGKGFTRFGAGYDELNQKAALRSCEAQAGLIKEPFDKDFGSDGDGFPDGCDICLGGDDSIDKDQDGIPDACDNDPKNAPDKKLRLGEICTKVTGSEKNWNEDKRQCKLTCYLTKDSCKKA